MEISVESSGTSGELVAGGSVFAPLVQKVNLPGIGSTVEAKRSYALFGVVAGCWC